MALERQNEQPCNISAVAVECGDITVPFSFRKTSFNPVKIRLMDTELLHKAYQTRCLVVSSFCSICYTVTGSILHMLIVFNPVSDKNSKCKRKTPDPETLVRNFCTTCYVSMLQNCSYQLTG